MENWKCFLVWMLIPGSPSKDTWSFNVVIRWTRSKQSLILKNIHNHFKCTCFNFSMSLMTTAIHSLIRFGIFHLQLKHNLALISIFPIIWIQFSIKLLTMRTAILTCIYCSWTRTFFPSKRELRISTNFNCLWRIN